MFLKNRKTIDESLNKAASGLASGVADMGNNFIFKLRYTGYFLNVAKKCNKSR